MESNSDYSSPIATTRYQVKPNGEPPEIHYTNENCVRRTFNSVGFGPASPKGSITPGTFQKNEWVYPQGSLSYSDGSYIKGGMNMLNWYNDWSYPDGGEIHDRCVQKLYEKANDMILDIALHVGERGELAKMAAALRSPCKSIMALTKQFVKHSDWAGGARATTKMVSAATLQYKLAVRPILSDIHNLCNAKALNMQDIIKVKSRFGIEDPIRHFGVDGNGYWNRLVSGTTSKRLEIELRFCRNPESMSLGRLTSISPASVAWELMPLSFVADQFINISGYLSAMEASWGIGRIFMGGYITETRKTVLEYKWSAKPLAGQTGGYAFASSREVYKSRNWLADFPSVAIPRMRAPKMGGEFLTTAAALLGALTF